MVDLGFLEQVGDVAFWLYIKEQISCPCVEKTDIGGRIKRFIRSIRL